jgi:hypothetical protein
MKTTTMTNRQALKILIITLLIAFVLALICAKKESFYAVDPYNEQQQYDRAWRAFMN